MHEDRLCFEVDVDASYDPTKMLFIFILDRALRDLESEERHVRRDAIKWFEGTKSLLPLAVGFQDILDMEFLSPRVLLEIKNRVWIAETNKVAA